MCDDRRADRARRFADLAGSNDDLTLARIMDTLVEAVVRFRDGDPVPILLAARLAAAAEKRVSALIDYSDPEELRLALDGLAAAAARLLPSTRAVPYRR